MTSMEQAQDKGAKSGTKPLLLAVAFGILGILLISQHVRQTESRIEQKYRVEPVWVLIAQINIPVGETIADNAIGYKRVARTDQPWSTIKTDDPEAGIENRKRYEDLCATLVGRTVNREIKAGDFILWTDFEKQVAEVLSETLPRGTRGVAVEVDRNALMGGLLQPNDRVDVTATYPATIEIIGGAGQSAGRAVNKTIVLLEDVAVVSVGGLLARNPAGRGPSERATVVLGLTPDQSLLLSHVQKEATISLLLRPREGAEDRNYARKEVSSTDVRDMLDRIRSAAGPADRRQ